MCQGCEDFREFERAFDQYIARELPKALAQPIDTDVLTGHLPLVFRRVKK